MTQDVAALNFAVDSSQVQYASTHLDTLRASAEATGRTVGQFGQSTSQARASVQAFRETAQALNQDLGASGTALDALMARLDATRTLLRSSVDAMRDFSIVRTQVEAVGLAFGATSTGIEAYYRQSQQLGLTTAQTVSSLQRVTEALTNQTMQGIEIRKVMQDYGVSLTGIDGKTVAADVALQRFTERLRVYADTAQKFRAASMVLGPLDPDSYGKVNDPGYISIDQKKREVLQSHYTTEIADRTRNAALIEKEANRNTSELADLSSKYNLGNLTSGQRGNLRSQAGLNSDQPIGSESDQLAMLRLIAKDPNGALADAADNRGVIGRQLGNLKTSAVGRAYQHVASGEAGANAQEIKAQFDLDRQNNGWLSAVGSNFTSTAQNLFNNYKPQEARQDQRDKSPIDKFLEDQTAAAKLAGYGDTGLTMRQRADEGLKSFQVDKKTNRPLEGASTDAMTALQGVHGTDEGEARFFQVRGRLQRARDTAMSPGQSEIDANDQQAYLLSLPREQRADAEAALKFAGSQGADVAGMLAGKPSFDQLAGLDSEIPNGMTPLQRKQFATINQGTTANRVETDAQAFTLQLDQALKQTAAAKDGAAAVENLTTKQAAMNQVLAAGRPLKEAELAGDNAMYLLTEKRRAQAAEMLGTMERENAYESARQAMLAEAGSDPTERARAASTSAVMTDYEKAKLANPSLDPAAYLKQRNQQVVNTAMGGASDTVAASEQQLKISQQALNISGQRADIQAKAASDAQVDRDFAEKRGQIESAGNAADLAALDEKIARTKELHSQVSALNQEAKNFSLGRDMQDSTSYDAARNALADPQARRRADLLKSSYMDNRGTGAAYQDAPGAPPQAGAPAAAPSMPSASSMPGPMGAGGGNDLSNGSAGTPGSVSARKAMAFRYFLSRGDTPAVAAGRLAGILTEDDNLDPAKPGDYVNGVPTAVGIMQAHPDRQKQFTDMFPGQTMGTSSLQDQLKFYYDDPDSIWNQHKSELQGATAYQAGSLISKYQERPGDQAGNMARRGNLATTLEGQMMAGSPGYAMRNDSVLAADDENARTSVINSNSTFLARNDVNEQARRQAGQPGQQAVTRAGFVDPNVNPIIGNNQRDQNLATVLSGQADQAAQTKAAADQSISDQARLAAAQDKGKAAVDATTRAIAVENEARQASTGIVDVQVRSQQMLAQASNAVANTIGSDGLKTRDAITDQKGLADAWTKGAGAAAEYQRVLALAPLEREIASLQAQGKNVDGLVTSYQKLKAAKEAEAGAAQDAKIQQGITTDGNRNALTLADNDLGPFASQQLRDRTRATAQANQDVANMPSGTSDVSKQNYLDQAAYNQTLKETTTRMEDFRSGYQGMMSSAEGTINNALMNGGKLKDVIGSVTKEWAGMLLKMAEKPAVDAAGSWLSSLFGSASKAIGLFGGGAPGADGVGAAGAGASNLGGAITGGYAAGGAFMGGVKMFASGGVLDRPTKFYSAGGQANVAGEAGDEGLLPLRRMANGDMGVSTGGGGGGITVHAPITVNSTGSTGSDGKMDPAAMDNMQRQLSESVRLAVLAGIADEKRPGGSLY